MADWTKKTRADELKEYSKAQEIYKLKQMLPPEISDQVSRAVSEERRGMLEQQINSGQFREKGALPDYINGKFLLKSGDFIPESFGNGNGREYDPSQGTQLGVVSGKSLIKKQAHFGMQGLGGGSVVGPAWRGANDTTRQSPEVYSPLWLNSNLNLPRERTTINAWCRSFYSLNPMVHNSISLHSTYPVAKLNIKSKNRRVEKFFSEMIEEIDLMNVIVQIAQEYWKLGEAFVYAELDESSAKWSRLLIQNPDYIEVKRSAIAGEPIISMRPDPNLKALVNSTKNVDVQQRMQLDPSIIEYVRRGQNIPLNNFHVSHLARRIAPYEIRGTGLIVSCFRSLMLLDKLKESKYVQADSMINPLTLVKIGNQEFRPTPVDIDAWKNVFAEAEGDKNFKIFTHDAVDVQRIGFGQGIYDVTNDITQCINEIYTGLMVPRVLMDGSDTTYANGSVALDVLRQRYVSFRNMLSTWLRKKIFAPISDLNGFYDYIEGQKTLIIPEVDWNHMSLFDMNDYINNLLQLTQGEPGQNKASLQTLYRSLGLEYEDEVRKMRYEDIQDAIRNKEREALDSYTLSELRALTPDSEIDEVVRPPLPGEDPYADERQGDDDEGSGMPGIGAPPRKPGGLPGGGSSAPGGGMRPPMGAGGAPPKGPGGVPKPPGGGAAPPKE